MSRTILVTGGAGYIGSRLIRDLATDPSLTGCTIRVYDNLQRETYNSLLDLPDANVSSLSKAIFSITRGCGARWMASGR